MNELTAASVMSANVLTVPPDMTVHELATFLTDNQISGAPVRDGSGRLLGMVSLTDIAEGEADGGRLFVDRSDPATSVHGWEDEATSEEMRDLHVGGADGFVRDIMTPAVYSVRHDTPVSEVARVMVSGRVHRLIVVRDRDVLGIVTSLDLLKLLTGEARPMRASFGARKRGAAARRRSQAHGGA
jgi:CBS domain-containing protein